MGQLPKRHGIRPATVPVAPVRLSYNDLDDGSRRVTARLLRPPILKSAAYDQMMLMGVMQKGCARILIHLYVHRECGCPRLNLMVYIHARIRWS
jgi:hypothetical protein